MNKRRFGQLAVGVAMGALSASLAYAQDGTPTLKYEFDLDVQVAAAQELGELGGGRRRVIPITGGTLRGPRLVGTVLAGGADWQTIRPDGVTLLQARYTIQMSDGPTIGVINTGVRRAAPEIVKRLTAGEIVDPSLYYFRTTPIFEVGHGPYEWLTSSIFVCVGQRLPDLVRMKIYSVG